MAEIRLKEEFVTAIKANPQLMGTIAQKLNKSTKTIERWCTTNDEKLTMLTVINCIREFKGLPKTAVLTINTKTENQAA